MVRRTLVDGNVLLTTSLQLETSYLLLTVDNDQGNVAHVVGILVGCTVFECSQRDDAQSADRSVAVEHQSDSQLSDTSRSGKTPNTEAVPGSTSEFGDTVMCRRLSKSRDLAHRR